MQIRGGDSQVNVLAPGARVVVRDEEWMIRSVKSTAPGGRAVHVIGTSELVRGKESIFLTEIDHVRELRPEETHLFMTIRRAIGDHGFIWTAYCA